MADSQNIFVGNIQLVTEVTNRPVRAGRAIPVYGYTAAERPLIAGNALPVRLVTQVEVDSGQFEVEAGPAMPVMLTSDLGQSRSIQAGAAIPVFATNSWPGSPTPPDEHPLLDGLEAYWPCDVLAGSQTPDIHDSIPLDDPVGSATVPGKVGDAIYTGVNGGGALFWKQVIPAALVPGSGSFSISFWLNVPSGGGGFFQDGLLIGRADIDATPYNYGVTYNFATGCIGLLVRDNLGNTDTLEHSQPFTMDAWHFVVVSFDFATRAAAVYLDNVGETDIFAALVGTAVASDAANFVLPGGQSVGVPFADGYFDEIAYYSRVLTPTEVAALFNSNSGMSYAQVASYTG